MKKKIIILSILMLFASGCSTVRNSSYDAIVDEALANTNLSTNVSRPGYKYYLPLGLRLLKEEGSNEFISKNDTIYYLFIDYISYFNKKEDTYTENKNAIYSLKIKKNDLFGYLEIKNTENDKYFIEIMYNYAKIEVIVEKEKANEAIAYAMSILSSITYQDTVLTSLMGEDVLKSNEVEHNIFETAQTESDYLQIVEEYGQYEEDETVDPDFIRR